MAKHEFGIMQKNPTDNNQFDTYEPQKYNCIEIDDDIIELISEDLERIACYCHSLHLI